jgi:hypothetical protein
MRTRSILSDDCDWLDRATPWVRRRRPPVTFYRSLWAAVIWAVVCAEGAADDPRPLPEPAATSSLAGVAPPRVFDVTKYGAVGDGTTDNTAAFSQCVQAVIDAGGGRIYVPAGVYSGRIIVPPVDFPGILALEITGESQPATMFGTVGVNTLQDHNSIIKCLATSGPAVVSAIPGGSQPGNFSGVHVVIKDLEVRTYNDPSIGGIDLEWVQQCRLENVVVNTGVYNVQSSKPTHGTTGVVTPAINNGALTVLRNVIVTGYHTGIVVNEHTDGDSIVVASNINGLDFRTAYHASHFGRVGAYRCTNLLTVTGEHGFSIEQLNIEHAGPGQTDDNNAWQATVNDINDPDNHGVADVTYWVVEGNVGISQVFTCNGGKSIRARRIGSAPAPQAQSEQ